MGDSTLVLLTDEVFAEKALELRASICRLDVSLKLHNVWIELYLIHTEM